MSFVDRFNAMTNMKTTENGAMSYSKLDSDVLSFFAVVGGMRKRDETDILEIYHAARKEDKELADKIILYVSTLEKVVWEKEELVEFF